MNDLRNDGADLPEHARERLAEMRSRRLFTSDLSVSEFVLVREAGFDPLGMVMGTSIYRVNTKLPSLQAGVPGCELTDMSKALYHARELAMNRMEEEAEALGADGIVGVRLTVNLSLNPQRLAWQQYGEWNEWSKKMGFRRPPTTVQTGYFAQWQALANEQWQKWCKQMGWTVVPIPPWTQPKGQAAYSVGTNTAEFIAVGTAVKHRGGENYRNRHGKPFQSDLSGQDFWLLIRSGYRPVGFVMGNCVYYVPPWMLAAGATDSRELPEYTHALYDARELAIERLQDEAEALGATGIVGVSVAEKEHSWRTDPWNVGNAALDSGEVLELFVVGTAVVPTGAPDDTSKPTLVFSANDVSASAGEGGRWRMTPALSELSVTEFVALTRIGFVPCGVVIGSCVYSAGSQYDWVVQTGEIEALSQSLRDARQIAVARMRKQAAGLGAEGVVDVRLEVEHHLWRGARQVAKCVAFGTAVKLDRKHMPHSLEHAPSLRLSTGAPFDSDLSTTEFVSLLTAGYRPITVAMGTCVYGLDPRELRRHRGRDEEMPVFTQAFFDARETSMERLQEDLFRAWPHGSPDEPSGIVGMTVSEATYGGGAASGPPIVEFTALGTAIAPLAADDPRRAPKLPRPRLVVSLDR